MNDQTTQLIEQLAQKLGTTTEYVWSVLLKQAPISATINLIYVIITIIVGLALLWTHFYFLKDRGDNESIYYEYEEAAIVPMVLITLVWISFFAVGISLIGNIVNGYFNPEYWALHEILSACK